MPIIACLCGKKLQVQEDQFGQTIQCPFCDQVIGIPVRDESATPMEDASDPDINDCPADSLAWESSPFLLSFGERDGRSSPLDFLAQKKPTLRRPYYQFYSPTTVAGCAMLGGLLVGCLVLALNYRRLKRLWACCLLALVGILGTLGILVVLWNYTDVPPGLPAIPYLGAVFLGQLVSAALILWLAARFLQGRLYALHLVNGGHPASWGGWSFPVFFAPPVCSSCSS
jgi:hypothetical protein